VGSNISIDLVVKDLVALGEETLNYSIEKYGNITLEYGQINNFPFQMNDDLVYGPYHDSQAILFTTLSPSILNINLNGYSTFSQFGLYNLTTEEFVTHNGGVLGGGSTYITFGSQSTTYTSPPLQSGEYKLIIVNGYSEDNVDTTLEFNLSDFNFEYLGLLSSPYNITKSNDFIFKVANTINYSLYGGGYLNYSSTPRIRIKNIDTNEIVLDAINGVLLPQLEPGEYLMYFEDYNNVTLVLNENQEDLSDINLGLIPTLPNSQFVSVDFTFETDLSQNIFFELNQNTTLNLDYIQDFYNYEVTVVDNSGNTVDSDSSGSEYNLSSGAYAIVIVNSPYWHCDVDNFCEYSNIQFDLNIDC